MHKDYDWKDDNKNFDPIKYILSNLGEKILNDPMNMAYIINYEPVAINYLSPQLKFNKNCAIQLCAMNGMYLAYFDKTIQDDNQVVMTAISKAEKIETLADTADTYNFSQKANLVNKHVPFQYASDRLKSDKEFILQAVGVNIANLYHMDEELFEDIPFMLELVDNNIEVFKHLPSDIKSHPELIEKVLKHDYNYFKELNETERDNIKYIHLVFNIAEKKDIPFLTPFIGKNTKAEMEGMELMTYIEKAMFRFTLEEKLPTRPDNVKKLKI